MATYAIGDVHGCFRSLERLLREAGVHTSRDRLLFTGDLVNRGPASLDVLRFVAGLGERAVCVLGNHDLHLIARADGIAEPKARDTLDDVLAAPDRDGLVAWLRGRPLVHREDGLLLVHAGLLPEWSAEDAERIARAVEAALAGPGAVRLLRKRPGTCRGPWDETLSAEEKADLALAAMTRMRALTRDGVVDVAHTGPPSSLPGHLVPWFEAAGRRSRGTRVVFGHWASLGLLVREDLVALDTGCVWGGALTCVRLDDGAVTQVAAD